MPSTLVGEKRIAINRSTSSIHDAETATKLGYRGAAVGANNHLDLFVPLLVALYGERWLERGALSLLFLNAVVSGEEVQAMAEWPANAQSHAALSATFADDPAARVCEGVATLDDHAGVHLGERGLRACDSDQLRLLRGLAPGQVLARGNRTATSDAQLALLADGELNEPLDWHTGPSPWGGPIASLNLIAVTMFRLLAGDGELHNHARFAPNIGDAFGMFGGFDLAFERGPVFLDLSYDVEATVVEVGQSPKTEWLLWEAVARDDAGHAIVRVRNLLRFLKASSPLYPELGG